MANIQKLGAATVETPEEEVKPKMFFLNLLPGTNEIVSVSETQESYSTKRSFSAAFLLSQGIFVDEFGKAELNSFVQYLYDKDAGAIRQKIREGQLEGMFKNTKRMTCAQAIAEGFTVDFESEKRHYRCEIEDQLAIMQAPMLAGLSEHKLCDIKCRVNDSEDRKFVGHTPQQCDIVQLAMYRHILQKRKEYAE